MSFDGIQFKNLAVRAGRVRGIEVWVHWFLLFIILVQLLNNYLGKPPIPFPFQSWLVSVGAMVLSIFLHEVGHCYAAFREGGTAERIILWPLGGLAECDAPQEPFAQLRVAGAGPLVNAALLLVSLVICFLLGYSPLPPAQGAESFPFLERACQYLVLWNVFLLALNLLPCYPPLDGGRMVLSLIWAKVESYGQAVFITLKLSLVFALVALVAGLLVVGAGFLYEDFRLEHPLLRELGLGSILVALTHFVEGRALRHRLQHGDEDEGIFGYDFSRGYTSLERTATREGKRVSLLGSLRERFRERTRDQRRQQDVQMRQKVDELLEKIHREGMGGLSRAEHRYLARASKRLRK